MTRYLLDTDALIDFSTGTEPATSWILSWLDGSDEVAVCSISVAEFYAGLAPAEVQRWEDFIDSLTYWDARCAAAIRAGQDRYRFARAGTTITTTDALIAAIAREQRATLVTGNVRHFAMQDLTLLSLR